jgi:hypothetical protein
MTCTFIAERRFQSGLSAPRVPEQFRFKQRFGNRRTVDDDKPAAGAQAQAVNRPCNKFLSAARRSGDQHGRVTPRQ